MILDIPVGLTRQMLDRLNLVGELKLVEVIGETVTERWRLDGDATLLSWDFQSNQVEISDMASEVQRAALQAAISAYGQPPSWYGPAQQVLELATSAVGVRAQDLTAAQMKALLATLLWDYRAIGNDLRVRPLAEWVRRRP